MSIFIDGWLIVHVYHFHSVEFVLTCLNISILFYIFYSYSSFTLQTESVSSAGTTFASEESAISTPKYPQKKKHLLIAFFSLSCLVIFGFLVLLKINLTKHCQKLTILNVWMKNLFINYFWLIIFVYLTSLWFVKYVEYQFMLWYETI